MIEPYLLAFWGVWLLVILIAASRVLGFSMARRAQDRRWKNGVGPQKPVALIVPVKGFDPQSTPRFFDAIFGQTYKDYRVIVCFESWDDPVARWLCEHLELSARHPVWTHPDPTSGLRGITLVCGGIAETEGQKVHNQRAAFADLTPRDAIIAFADADILCGPDWLARLAAPINRATHELSTTYRWLVPKRPTLPNQLACIINASITTQGGAEWSTVLWGGSMALTRELFDELDVPHLLAGSLNDDLRLSKAARATGRKIAFVRSLILPTPIDFTWGTFFEFVRRQYTQVKFFSPILYTGVNFVLGFYVLGAATIVAALVYGYFYAWIPVAAAYVIDQFRTLARQQVYLSLFKENGIRQKLVAAGWLEHMLTPFWMTLHWILLASTWTQSRLTWAGVRYQIDSKSKTRVLHRSATATPLPAGAPGLAMLSALNDLRRGAMPQPHRPVGAPTAPLEPLATDTAPETIETAEVVATGTAPESVESVLPAAAEIAPGIEVEAAIYSACEEAPSAILPLTASFHERPERQRVRASDRGALGAAEFLLGKTRALPHRLHATPAPVVAKASERPTPTGESSRIPLLARRGRVLTAAERALDKTRLHQAGVERTPAGQTLLSRPQPPARLDRVRSRMQRSLVKSPPVSIVAAPAPTAVLKPALRSSAPRSLAGRRASLGANLAAVAPGRGIAARSLRPLSSGRIGCHPNARPLPPGASARP
jgi:cellulose synthase/poly-beta-1,6-N-acetylglucosamine synthase-like glycosyltransferase